ncbi:MAG: GNAT family N-acetyltransferase, partial [Pseudomonadales bacterium]|nr:GNAT family N-acetyltransferase [Pseudomonadales bacterium]
YTIVPYSRSRLPDLLGLVSRNARDRWPLVGYLMNSDVAWQLPGSAPKENIRLWYDDQGLAAYAWFQPNSPVTFDVRCDIDVDSTLGIEAVDWIVQRTREFPRCEPWLVPLTSMAQWEQALTEERINLPSPEWSVQIFSMDTDAPRNALLERLGFEPTAHFEFKLTRSLEKTIPAPALPNGVRLRHVEPPDFEERVATHRDAWFKSGFTMDRYLRVRAIPEFVPELDIVAEDQNGTFGSYCIGWVDHDMGVGSFEPVGTRPAYRRMGLGQAVNYEGLRRMKAMGMHSAKIGTAGFNDRAFGLYTSCGFELVDKERTWLKRIG